MSTNQGESKDFFSANYLRSHKHKTNSEHYSIIVVSRNIQIHQALEKTLLHFSLNGKGINFFSAENLQEAQKIAELYPDIILVVIDDDIQVNGSYKVFVDYIRKSLGNKICCIAFKDNLISTSTCTDPLEVEKDENLAKFFYARERLVDITRMVMMTTEMEGKINNSHQVDSQLDQDYKEKTNDTKFIKDKMYNVMANDLREPVGNIKVMLDFLTNEPELLDQNIYTDLLARVRESAHNIHEMLEDFLFWSRMFKQEIYFNPGMVDLSQLARENLVLLKSSAASKKIKIQSRVPENTYAFADEYMITTVIRNLIYNAIKFTQEGGEIQLTASMKNEMVEFQVKDNGIGIPMANLDKIFRTDIRLSTNGTENESGAGMGLALCKEFVERNGGQISIHSKEGQGSTFIFTLPQWSFAELT